MRELPSLTTLCMRALGAPSCSPEVTFAQLKSGEISAASRMLRSLRSSNSIARQPCIGTGSARRANANDVDLNHPFIACREKAVDDPDGIHYLKQPLLLQYGNSSLSYLQAYIDTLVEMGRMDDSRLGVHFFREWKANLNQSPFGSNQQDPPVVRPAKKRRSSASASQTKKANEILVGALSLHNCTIGQETVTAIIKAQVGPHLAVLDLTGIRGITDLLVQQLLEVTPNLERVSFKNCRKLTNLTCQRMGDHLGKLQCVDLGGCFNISTNDALELVQRVTTLDELHASGLLWDNETIRELVSHRTTWKGLSLGFSLSLSQSILRESLISLSQTLDTLALPFCETVVDNALMGILGRNLPFLRALDVRGNTALNTLTGWYDGRVSAELDVQNPLVVLARYSGVSSSSVEETQRTHPRAQLTVILDGEGMGAGVTRFA